MEQTLLVAPETPWPPRGSSCELANNANSRKYRKYRLHQSDKIWAYCQGMLCEAQFYSTSLALSAFGVSFPVFLQLFLAEGPTMIASTRLCHSGCVIADTT